MLVNLWVLQFVGVCFKALELLNDVLALSVYLSLTFWCSPKGSFGYKIQSVL